MGIVEAITQQRFVGHYRARKLEVVVEPFEDPLKAQLLVDGQGQGTQDIPARFNLDDEAVVEVDGKGRTITHCAIVSNGRQTNLTLADDDIVRRYIGFRESHPGFNFLFGVVSVAILVGLFILGAVRPINWFVPENIIEGVGLSYPIDLPFHLPVGIAVIAIVAFLMLLGLEEDIRKAHRRFLVATTAPVTPRPVQRPIEPSVDSVSDGKPKDVWDERFDTLGNKVETVTKSRFLGKHDGRQLEVVFDFFDEPTHARLLVDGVDNGNKAVPATFDLGNGATLEAKATPWAVLECAVVSGGLRHRLTPKDNRLESGLHRFWSAHPVLDSVVQVIGLVVIVVAAVLGIIDLYNVVPTIAERISENVEILEPLANLLGKLPPISLPISLTWWQAILLAVIPMAFAFDKDVRKSNEVFETQDASETELSQ